MKTADKIIKEANELSYDLIKKYGAGEEDRNNFLTGILYSDIKRLCKEIEQLQEEACKNEHRSRRKQ